jgi:hypothetical protein
MRITILSNLILFFAILFTIPSCSGPLNDYVNTELSCKESISEITFQKEFIFLFKHDTVITQANVNDNYYTFKCKDGKRVYRKKKFRLYPLKTDSATQKSNHIVDLNNELKHNDLIGVFSKKIVLNNKSYLFQEEIGKRIIESNKRREGIILKITIQDSTILVSSIKNKPFDPMLEIAIQNYIKNNILNECFIDETNTLKFNSIVQKHLGNVKPNYFYLNPITNKVEPILCGLSYVENKNSNEFTISNCENKNTYLKFFEINQHKNILSLKEEKCILSEKIIIPKGFTIEINKGQEIDIINNASILSYSPINFKGTLKNKIIIYSTDTSGQGIHIIQNNQSSTVNHVVFSNQNSFTYKTKLMSWTLPSALTFYGGEVEINNSEFKNLFSEDAINTFRCKFTFTNSTIENTFSDAFDADFCFGTIDNCSFINCGNDAVDISGGELNLKNSKFSIVKDKAISAGEESVMNISNCKIENSSLGIISKDLSKVNSLATTISNCEIAYCAFQKKGEFGPASIVVTNNIETNCEKIHLIEFKSTCSLNDTLIKDLEYNVIDYLYGSIYGKATVK